VQIRRFSGTISRTANFIGMGRSALHRKLKLLGITELREEQGGAFFDCTQTPFLRSALVQGYPPFYRC